MMSIPTLFLKLGRCGGFIERSSNFMARVSVISPTFTFEAIFGDEVGWRMINWSDFYDNVVVLSQKPGKLPPLPVERAGP